MVNGNIVTIHIGELDREIFRKHPVWCEYYTPDEIDELVALGEDPTFLNNEIIQKLETSDGHNHPYYSLPGKSKLKREFLYIKAIFYILNTKKNGYVALINNEINTIRIFYNGDDVVLYLNEDFSDDNYDTMLKITGQKFINDFDLNYELKCNDEIHTKKGNIIIPCSDQPFQTK